MTLVGESYLSHSRRRTRPRALNQEERLDSQHAVEDLAYSCSCPSAHVRFGVQDSNKLHLEAFVAENEGESSLPCCGRVQCPRVDDHTTTDDDDSDVEEGRLPPECMAQRGRASITCGSDRWRPGTFPFFCHRSETYTDLDPCCARTAVVRDPAGRVFVMCTAPVWPCLRPMIHAPRNRAGLHDRALLAASQIAQVLPITSPSQPPALPPLHPPRADSQIPRASHPSPPPAGSRAPA